MQQRRQDGEDRQGDTGVEANARLTAYTAVVLLLPLVVVSLTGLIAPHLLPAHFAIGFLAVPPATGTASPARLAVADWQDQLRGATQRRGLVLGSLVLGAALAVALLPYPSPFTAQGG